MNRATFEIAYEGPAVDAGIMDVRELAPALLALGALVENSNRVIGDPNTEVKVVVRSGFESGSFKIGLEVIYNLVQQLKLLLDLNRTDNPAETLISLIGFASGTGLTGFSLMKLIKSIRGRPIKSATTLENGNVRLELSGENGRFDYIEVDEKVVRLYRDRSVRESLSQVIQPLKKEGITGFAVKKGKEIIERVTKDEIRYYDIPELPEEEQVITSRRRAFVRLIEIAFEENLKWRLSDGENKFYATIEDRDFLDQINKGKPFSKGDVLEVELETTQVASFKGIRNEYRVLKVIKHLSRPQQIPLPFDKQE